MNAIKQYLFYIISAVVLIAFVVIALTVEPRLDQSGAQNLTPQSSKQQADSLFTTALKEDLERRARATLSRGGGAVPAESLSPEKKEDVTKLLDDFIIDDSWEDNAKSISADYQRQLAGIRSDLGARSEALSQRVSTSPDPGSWYLEGYDVEARALVQRCLEGGLVVAGSEEVDQTIDPLADGNVRNLLGLTTQTTRYPDASAQPLIREQLRIAQAVAEALLGARAMSLPNPNLVNDKGEQRVAVMSEPQGVRIVSWNWRGVTDEVGIPGVKGHRLELVLEGSLSSLLSAAARLDIINRPVMVRLGSTWGAATGVGSRSANADSPTAPADKSIQLRTTLLALDFRSLSSAVADSDQEVSP